MKDTIRDDLVEQCEELQKQNNILWNEREQYRKRLAVVEAAGESTTLTTWALLIIIVGLIVGHIWRSM